MYDDIPRIWKDRIPPALMKISPLNVRSLRQVNLSAHHTGLCGIRLYRIRTAMTPSNLYMDIITPRAADSNWENAIVRHRSYDDAHTSARVGFPHSRTTVGQVLPV
jgi:hypothetical protein